MCELEEIYGFQKEIRGGIVFAKRSTLFYIAGQTGIFHRVPENSQKCIPLPQIDSITAMALNANGILALATRGREPKIVLINLKTNEKTSLPNPNSFNSHEVVQLSFSNDNEYLAAHGGSPSWTFVLWYLKTRAVLQSFLPFRLEPGAKVFEFAFCPEDSNVIAAVGKFYLRMYFHQGGRRFREEVSHDHERSNRAFHSVAWLRGCYAFAVGTSDGTVLVLRRGQQLNCVTLCDKLCLLPRILEHIGDSDNRNVSCLLSTKEGFLCTYGGNTVLSLNRKDTSYDFEIKSSISIPETADSEPSNIVQMVLNSDEDALVVTTEDGQVHFFPLKNVEALKETGFEAEFEVLVEHQLHGSLVDGDTAGFKTVHVACSSSEVIIWQYDERKVLQRKRLDKGITNVSIQPQGFNILIGYDTGAKLYNILYDKIEEVWEFDTRMSRVGFSKEGHLMAITNRKRIELYSSVSLGKIGEFKGHHDEVNSMMWKNLDNQLLTSDHSGQLIEWDIPTQKMVWSFSGEQTRFSQMANAEDNRTFYVSTIDSRIWLFQDHQKTAEVKTPETVTSLAVSESMLLAGTENGSVLGYPLDLSANCLFQKRHHKGKILDMALIFGGESLLVVGENAAISVWKVEGRNENPIPLLYQVLIDQTTHEERLKEIENREKELVATARLSKEKRCRLSKEQEIEREELKAKYENMKSQLESTIPVLVKYIYKTEIESETKRLQKNEETLNDIDANRADYEEKLEKEAERWELLKKEKIQITEINESKIKDLKEIIEKTEAKLKEKRELSDFKIAELENKIKEEAQKCKDLKKKCKEELERQQKGREKQAKEIESQQESELEKAREENEEKRKEIKRMQAKINYEKECGHTLDAACEAKKKMHYELKEIIQKIKLRISHVSKDVERKEHELKDKIEMVKVLEDDAKEFKHMTSEANLKVQESKETLKQKEEELLKLSAEKDQLENTQKSLTTKLKSQQRVQKLLDEKLQSMEKSMDDYTQKILGAQLLLESYRNEFIEATKNLEGANALRWAFLDLVDKRASKSRLKEEEVFAGDTDPYLKFCRQRDHYESLINTVLQRKHVIQAAFRNAYVKLAKENSDWIAFAEALHSGLQHKTKRIQILEQAVKMPAQHFSKDPQETQRRFNKFYEKMKSLEQQEQEEIRKRLDLIKEQEKEIQRLHGLLVVEEKGKVTRRGGY